MRFVIQRVKRASVTVAGEVVGEVGEGLLVLAGFGKLDALGLRRGPVWTKMIEKTLDLRIFPDTGPGAEGKMNLSLREVGGGLLVVSQFTLYAECRKGRRPSFTVAAHPDIAERLFAHLVEDFGKLLPGKVSSGIFGADMDVELLNWGPVTIVLDDADFMPAREA